MARVAGVVEYVAGYPWTVYDCDACGCRFTPHDNSVYDLLHESGAISYYSNYRELAVRCQSLFEQQDREGLKRVLCGTPKYRFIIEHVAHEKVSSQLLEVGCSRGYLTSYFILEGRPVLGLDVSPEAIGHARAAFGDHFAVSGSDSVSAAGPHDVIYHVGMIGCVSDPVGLTRQLLAMLKPGGRLLFNAPNRAALHLREQLWLDSAPPPDLVTLFPEGFWKRHFLKEAEVVEDIEMLPTANAVTISLRALCHRRWTKPVPQRLADAGIHGHSWTQHMGAGWRLFEKSVLKVARLTGLARLVPPRQSEFGLFVEMTAR
jgi:SAM-dependent methyltransferase